MGFPDFSNYDGKLLTFHTPKNDSTGETLVFVNLANEDIKIPDHDSDRWTALDTAIASVWRHPRFLFGFDDREHMLRFASNIVNGKLASLLAGGEVRYIMARKEKQGGDSPEQRYWYQATLESEELKGMSAT